VSLAVVVLCAILGFFVGSLAWIVARNQATQRPLWGPPRCETALGISISPKAQAAAATEGETEPVVHATDPTSGCGAPLPTLAWLPLYGFGTAFRCPNCETRQSLWRATTEVLTALYFAIAASRIGDGLHLTAVLIFTLPLLVIFLVDTWTRLIYTNVIYLGTAAGLIFALAEGDLSELFKAVLAMIAALAVFLLFYFFAGVFYRSVKVVPFGRGDIYLAVMIASMVRLDGLVRALFLGILLAAVGGLFLLATKRVSRRQAMPYGPYLCLGALIALIWQV
jgi:prepilin signal peptidase PulO-like enzyme (type II secretory pathway)